MCANTDLFFKTTELIFSNKIEDNIGIHLNITEGVPLTDKIKKDAFFCDTNGCFHGKINRRTRLTKAQKKEIYDEFTHQISKLRKEGIKVTHCDSHHHIHTAINIVGLVVPILKENNINKIRISRNIGQMGISKRIIKDIYINRILSKNFKTVQQFGSICDYESGEWLNRKKSLEIMVHPDFNKYGVLIDRIDYEKNCIPVGSPLSVDINIKNNYKLCSYIDL